MSVEFSFLLLRYYQYNILIFKIEMKQHWKQVGLHFFHQPKSIFKAISYHNYLQVCPTGYEFLDGVCKDIDECQAEICGRHGDCENLVGGYRCACHAGFQIGDDDFICLSNFFREIDFTKKLCNF